MTARVGVRHASVTLYESPSALQRHCVQRGWGVGTAPMPVIMYMASYTDQVPEL